MIPFRVLSHVRLVDPIGQEGQTSVYQTHLSMMTQLTPLNPLLCKNCATDQHILEDRSEGTRVCSSCGLVVGILIDTSEYKDQERSSHLDPDDQLRSVEHNNGFKHWIKPKEGGIRKEGIQTIKSVMDEFNETKRTEYRVVELFKALLEEVPRKINKSSLLDCIAACVYCGLKAEGVSRTIKELIVTLNCSKQHVNKWISIINKIDSSKSLLTSTSSYNSPATYVERYATELGMNARLKTLVEEMIERVIALECCVGRSPATVAAGCIALVGEMEGESFTQDEVGQAMAISTPTISATVEVIRKSLENDLGGLTVN